MISEFGSSLHGSYQLRRQEWSRSQIYGEAFLLGEVVRRG